MDVNIEGLNRADVLAALYNNSRPQGMGFLHFDAAHMDASEATELLSRGDYFDYLKGRVMKIRIPDGAKLINTSLYDRDLGDGAGARVIERLRDRNKTISQDKEYTI